MALLLAADASLPAATKTSFATEIAVIALSGRYDQILNYVVSIDVLFFGLTGAVLMGMASEIPSTDMDRFTDFMMTVKFAPNSFRNLDNTMPSTIVVPSLVRISTHDVLPP